MPTTSVTIEATAAINRVRWSGNGHQLAAGDDDGFIYIYDIGEVRACPCQQTNTVKVKNRNIVGSVQS